MFKLLAVLACFLTLLFAVGVTRADDLLARFRKEYPLAAEKLEKAYSRSKALGTLTTTDSHGAFRSKVAYEFWRRAQAVRSLETFLQSNSDKAPAGTIGAIGGTAERFFQIYRLEGQKEYTVAWFGPRDDFEPYTRFNLTPLYAAYCLEDYRIVDFLTDPGSVIKSANMDSLDGQNVARIDFTTTTGVGIKSGVLGGSIYLIQPSWAIAGWHTTVGPPDVPPERTDRNVTLEGRVSYKETSAVPTVSKVHIWRVRPTGRTEEFTWDVGDLQFVDIPPDQFQLKTFGVQEPPAPITPGQKDSGSK